MSLVSADPDPLLDDRFFGPSLAVAQPKKLPHFSLDHVYFVVARALPSHLALRAIGIADKEGRPRMTAAPGLAARSFHNFVAKISQCFDMNGEWQHVRRPHPGEVLVNRRRLGLRVGKYRAVRHRPDLAM